MVTCWVSAFFCDELVRACVYTHTPRYAKYFDFFYLLSPRHLIKVVFIIVKYMSQYLSYQVPKEKSEHYQNALLHPLERKGLTRF